MEPIRFRPLLAALVVLLVLTGSVSAVAAQGSMPIEQTSGGANQTVDDDDVAQTVDPELVSNLLAVLIALLDEALSGPPPLGNPPGWSDWGTLRFCDDHVVVGQSAFDAIDLAVDIGLLDNLFRTDQDLIDELLGRCRDLDSWFDGIGVAVRGDDLVFVRQP